MRSLLLSSFLSPTVGDHQKLPGPVLVVMALDSVRLESFSFRWLISIKDDSTATAASFIDIDPNLVNSFRWTVGDDAQGSLDIEKLESSHLANATAADSGGVFWNGLLIPPPTGDLVGRSGSLDSTEVLLSLSQRYEFPSSSIKEEEEEEEMLSPERRRRFQTEIAKVLKKYLCFVLPLYKKVKESGKKKTGTDRRRPGRASVVAINEEEHEKSIHEAVLHCKKSSGV